MFLERHGFPGSKEREERLRSPLVRAARWGVCLRLCESLGFHKCGEVAGGGGKGGCQGQRLKLHPEVKAGRPAQCPPKAQGPHEVMAGDTEGFSLFPSIVGGL